MRYIQKPNISNVEKIGVPQATEGLIANTGIRLGCPLSPILFAIVADLLLRELKQE